MTPMLLIIALLWMPEAPITSTDGWYIERIEPLTEETDHAEVEE